jgi:hypothetical protein
MNATGLWGDVTTLMGFESERCWVISSAISAMPSRAATWLQQSVGYATQLDAKVQARFERNDIGGYTHRTQVLDGPCP